MGVARCFFLLLFFCAQHLLLAQQDSLLIYAEDTEFTSQQFVCVPIKVIGFSKVEVLQFSINFSRYDLEFVRVDDFHPESGLTIDDIGTTNADKGILNVSFVDPISGGHTITDTSTLFEACFLVRGKPGTEAYINISEYNRKFEAFGDARFLQIVGSYMESSIQSPSEMTVHTSSCIDNQVSGYQGIISFSTYGGNPNYIFNITKESNPNFQRYGQASEGQTYIFSNLESGMYTIQIVDATGTEKRIPVSVGIGQKLTIKHATLSPTCPQSSDGRIEITSITGGTPPYQIVWSDSTVAQPYIEDVSYKLYTAQVTDSHGCWVNIIENLKPKKLKYKIQKTLPSCPQVPDGKIEFQATNVVYHSDSTIQYSIDSITFVSDTSFTIEHLLSGSFPIYIRDSMGCNYSSIIDFPAENEYLMLVQSIKDVDCTSDTSGAITFETYKNYSLDTSLQVSMTPAKGQITKSDTAFHISNLDTGAYQLTIIDEETGCKIDTFFRISHSKKLVIDVIEIGDEQCKDDLMGYANITVNGGSGNNMYQWSNGSSEQNLHTVNAGNYSVTVSDDTGCKDTTRVLISKGTEIFIADTVYTLTSCHGGNDGSISVIADSREGIASKRFSFTWSSGNPVTKDDTSSIYGISEGTYSVAIEDEKGCVTTSEFNLLETAPISITTETKDTFNCIGENSAFLSLSTENGEPPYSYLWNTGKTSSRIDSLSSGYYSVTVIDALGCTQKKTFEITEGETLTLNITKKDPRCAQSANGRIYLDVLQDARIDTIFFSFPTDTISLGNYEAVFVNVPIGTYTITVIDTNGCTFAEQVTLETPSLDKKLTLTPPTCNDSHNGQMGVTVSNSSLLKAFSIAPMADTIKNAAYDILFDSLSHVTYILTLTDTIGCETTDTITFDTINVDYQLIIDSLSCFGSRDGGIHINYIYPDTFERIEIYPDLNSTSSDKYDISFQNLPSDTFEIMFIDTNGCVYIEEIYLLQPDPIEVSMEIVHASNLREGSCNAQVKGGTKPYTYIWSVPGAGDVSEVTNLKAGEYTLVVIDHNGCRVEISFEIMFMTSIAHTNNIRVGLFPNPIQDEIFITVDTKGQYNYRIVDLMGHVKKKGEFTGQKQRIATSTLSNGVYSLLVKNKFSQKQITFLIQR